MFSKSLLITLLCGLAVAIAEIDVDTIFAQHKQTLKRLLNTPDKRYGGNQQGQQECFNWYFDALDRNMEDHRANNTQCTTNYNDTIKWYNQYGNETRNDFESRTDAVCKNFEWCEWNKDLLEFYSCYSQVSTSSTPIIYLLSADSGKAYNSLLIEYNQTQSNRKMCEKKAREEYLRISEVTDKLFEDCRTGIWFPTTYWSTIGSTTPHPVA